MNANGQETDPPKQPDCRFVEDGSDPDTDDDPEHMTTATRTGDVRFIGVKCADPPGMPGSAVRYYAYVQRVDGWWRSRESLLSVSYNERYCHARLSAKWRRKGPHLLARVAAGLACLACGKQGDRTLVYDLIIAIDQDGAKPATYRAIPVGEHTTEQRRADGDPAERCGQPEFDAVLAEKWPDPDTLVLRGPATWHALNREEPWFYVWNGVNEEEPSGVGTYRLVR
jgi:hypothetical protein